jgi:hypothetical protein
MAKIRIAEPFLFLSFFSVVKERCVHMGSVAPVASYSDILNQTKSIFSIDYETIICRNNYDLLKKKACSLNHNYSPGSLPASKHFLST